MTAPAQAVEATDSRVFFDDLYWQDQYEAITEDDAFLEQVVAESDLPSLLAAIAAVTRDTSILTEDIRPPMDAVNTRTEIQGGMDEETQARARVVALEGLKRIRDEKLISVGKLSKQEVREILLFLQNGKDDPDWMGLLTHELDLAEDKGGPADWHFDDVARGREFKVLVVGAALSGLAASYRLKGAGIPFTIIEASDGIGGTWWKNRYPGVRLDTPTYGYSFSFAQRPDWPHQFAEGHEIREYMATVARESGIDQDVEFKTSLVKAVWDEEGGVWHATTRTWDGIEQTRPFNSIITGVGQLDHPNIPDFPGREKFKGAQMHTQEWDHEVQIAGKRVAVIGTGASAYQVVPAIVDEVSELYVFQRNAPWMLPAPTYHEKTSDAFRWLVAKVPHYGQWFRLWVTLVGIDGLMHAGVAEEGWEGAPHSVSEENHKLRERMIGWLSAQLEDHPEKLEHMIPSYAPATKRMLRDNGVWSRALTSPQTTLVLSGVDRFTENGIVTGDGTEIEADVVVYATGFRPSDYLDGMEFVGRDGKEIHEYWGGDAKGFGGITVPGYPNLYILMGPNTGGVVAGGLYFMIERAAEYAIKSMKIILDEDAKALDLKQEALDEFMEWVDAENYRMAWGQSYAQTWYKNSTGRVAQVRPFRLTDYWRITETVDRDHYEAIK
jgi:4-hydroxyacetophenone monooxygenase